MDGGANSHIFRQRKHFWKYTPISSSVTTVSGAPAPAVGLGIVPIMFPKSGIIILLYPCYHMPNNPQNTLGLPPLKHYNQTRSTRLEALSWLRIVHKDGRAVRVSTIPKFHADQLLDYVSIKICVPSNSNLITPSKLPSSSPKSTPPPPSSSTVVLPPVPFSAQSPASSPTADTSQIQASNYGQAVKVLQTIVNSTRSTFVDNILEHTILPQTCLPIPKINKSFSKHDFQDWTILHRRMDHISDDKLAKMCTQKLLNDLAATYPTQARIHRRQCWICPRGALHNDPHGITLNTDHLRLGQLIHMDFYFMNKVSIRGFTCVLNVCDAKCRKLWQFCTPSKRPPISTVRFFLRQLQMMGRPCSHLRTDMGGELATSAEFCTLLKDEFQIALQVTGPYTSWINGKVERHNQTSCEMIRVGTIDHGLGPHLWCLKCEDTTTKYNATLHSAINDIPDFLWYGTRPSIADFRIFGCKLEARLNNHLAQLDARCEDGYYVGTTATKSVIRYWRPEKPNTINYCTTARFFEHNTKLPDGNPSPGSLINTTDPPPVIPSTTINIADNPLLASPPYIFQIALPPAGSPIGITDIKQCQYHNMPYIVTSTHGSIYYSAVPQEYRHNVWILAIGNNSPITAGQAQKDITSCQVSNTASEPITFIVAKRDSRPPPTTLQNDWAVFSQFRIVPHHVVDSSAIVVRPEDEHPLQVPPTPHALPSSSTLDNATVTPDSTPLLENDPDIIPQSTSPPEPSPAPRRSSRLASKSSNKSTPTLQPRQVLTTDQDKKPSPPQNLRRSSRKTQTSQRTIYPSERHLTTTYGQAANHLLHKPVIARITNLPKRPECPPHIGQALKSPLRQLWIDCLYDSYDKMHKTGTLSLPFPITNLPNGYSILRPRITCEVKITDSDHYYELKCRLCADGSSMIMGLDYDISYAPVIEGDALLLMMAIATSRGLTFYFLDISNAFQSNVIHDPTKRHYMHLPTLYMQWFRLRFPNHPLCKIDMSSIKYIFQTLRGIQGTKDAGYEWYQLLASIFTKVLNMVPSVANKGLFHWSHGNHYAYIALATDDILVASSDVSLFHLLEKTLKQYFSLTSATGPLLHFLNYRIIQSDHGVSFDQYSHIRQTLLQPFFHLQKKFHFNQVHFHLILHLKWNYMKLLHYQTQNYKH